MEHHSDVERSGVPLHATPWRNRDITLEQVRRTLKDRQRVTPQIGGVRNRLIHRHSKAGESYQRLRAGGGGSDCLMGTVSVCLGVIKKFGEQIGGMVAPHCECN